MNLNAKALARLLLVTSAAILLPACDKASPVAPDGTTVSLSANPSQVSSTTGASTITAIVRKANGTPVVRGTEVRFATNLGSVETLAETDNDGIARVTLRGDGRQGTATVTASVGGTVTTPPTTTPPTGGGTTQTAGGSSVEVEIGLSSGSIVLQPTPTFVGVTGGTINLVALVRDSRGQPLAGAGVNFTTDLGRLNSGGRIVNTDSNGQARDTLTITQEDVDAFRATSFSVTAQTTKGDGTVVEDTFAIQVNSARPVADFSVTSGGNYKVNFADESGGEGPFLYQWTFGDGQPTSSESSPTHQYPQVVDEYTVTLRISSPTQGDDTESKRIRVQETSVEIVSTTPP